MKKINNQTPDLTEKNIEEIAKLFPQVITEKESDSGKTTKAVDFDLLKQELSKIIVDDDERYRLDWPGKKASILQANTPINKTLRPVRKDSVDFENTENLYIEGDNFEVLKILQESYLGKVKMIYIDPPYNTGNDFVYKDNFRVSKEKYEEEIGTTDEDGGKLFKNTDTNGRYHSDWLSMMYTRLVVARDLLKDDGVIFMSIDDNEVHNLRKIADEVFGEENFIGNITWESKTKSQNTKTAYNKLQPKVEYILVYTKKDFRRFHLFKIGKKEYIEKDKKGSYREYPLEVMSAGGIRGRESMIYPIENIIPPIGKQWQLGKESIDIYKKREDLFVRDGAIILKMRPNDEKIDVTQPFWGFISKEKGTAESAKKELTNILRPDKHGFETVKPIALIHKLIFHSTNANDIILDFFSGSATTAHAVMQLNAEDGGNRKFIMVQLPEETDEKSEAYKAGYKNICEIGKERIRRAGKKITSELKENNRQLKLGEKQIDTSKLDIGFRVYKVDSTNKKDVERHPTEIVQQSLLGEENSAKQESLLDLVDNIKNDRTPEDLLTQVILALGLELSLPIKDKDILRHKVFFVQQNALVACFNENINPKLVDEIAKLEPLKVVFRDSGFKDDKDRINIENRFKRLSPETEISVI